MADIDGFNNETADRLTFGFDIGIASVGWAVLGETRLVAWGVRAFDKAEADKTGEPLNLTRRMARLGRRRLRRRAWRLIRLGRVLKREGLLAEAAWFQSQPGYPDSTWHLRVAALERALSDEEWARVIYHLCKHRGFHWTSRADRRRAESDVKGEGGKVKQGLANTTRLMADKGYRTAAEMMLREYPDAQRSKQGDYTRSLPRTLLAEELATLFSRQRDLGQPHAHKALEARLLDRKTGLLWAQQPALAGSALLAMLGHCTFERSEFRAPKASFSAERHVWLTRLNNLRIIDQGTVRALTDAERAVALPLPYGQSGDLTYKQLHGALTRNGLVAETFTFAGLRPLKDGKEPMSQAVVRLPGWQELRQTLSRAGLVSEWNALASAALNGSPDLLDRIAWTLSVFKDDEEVASQLAKLDLPGAPGRVADALLDIRFDKFHALSLKALRKIIPHMAAGLRYDQACLKAGYHHSQPVARDSLGGHDLLPPFYSRRARNGRMLLRDDIDMPRNPVVLRALNQARKVLNALVRRYGAPAAVHIEMARDLSRNIDERRKIEKEQMAFRERNVADRAEFGRYFQIVGSPSGRDFEKWRLYREQQGKCAYSLGAIELHRLLEPGYVEVDHALPYSRSFDDSKNNKVLAFVKENREKGNRTPFEYLGGAQDAPRWQQFVAVVQANPNYRIAKRSRLLRRNFGNDEAAEFKERNLNDTRYVCRFFKNYVEGHLRLASGTATRRCVVVSGQLTAFLRARWGLVKLREESDRHHALDAAVVAACSHGMVKRLSDCARTRELAHVRDGFVDAETGEIVDPAVYARLERHFPAPWLHFRHELEARLRLDDPAQLRAELALLGTYPSAALDTVRPLFVSRAPRRRGGGAAHKETIYAQPDQLAAQGGAVEKVPLASLRLADLGRLIDPHRNVRLYAAVRDRLEAHGGKGDKAFPPDNPLRKPGPDGAPTGPVVRSVKLKIEKLSGVAVRGGIARNDTMLRVDVFRKAGRFYLVPVYVHHVVTGLPNRAIVAFKDEADWTPIDSSFEWRFSLHANDYVRLTLRTGPVAGYFAGCDRANGTIDLWAHDRSAAVGIKGFIHGVGAKTAIEIEKFDVDVLGRVRAARPEPRRGLA